MYTVPGPHPEKITMQTIIGVDVGGTQLRAARFDNDLNMIPGTRTDQDTYPDQMGKQEASQKFSSEDLHNIVFGRLIDTIRRVLPEDKSEVRGIGLALPGPVNSDSGILIAPPALPWRNFNIRSEVEKAIGVPVFIGNDADLAGLAECYRGVARQMHLEHKLRYLIYITVSTGVGGGLIIDGKPFNGRGQGAEVGHMVVVPDGPMCGCGHRGHLEAVSSGTAIARLARHQIEAGRASLLRELSNGDLSDITAKLVGEAAAKGDALSLEVVTQAGRYLGVAVASLMTVFNPDIFVFGGSVTKLGKLLFEPMGAAIREYAMHPLYWETTPIVQAKLGDDVGLYGSAALVVAETGS
jgi:glucokinase